MERLVFLFIFLMSQWAWCYGAEDFDFFVNKTSKARISVAEGRVVYEVKTNEEITTGYFEIYAEAKLKIKSDDFNFDGNFDFDVWHFDEGMGVYTIHRVFVFNPSGKIFYEIFPGCGDQFINLEINKRKRVLYSTFFFRNKPKRCATRFVLR